MTSPDSYCTGTIHALEEHSFSDAAAQAIRQQHPTVGIAHEPDIERVWQAMETEGHYGVIPIENSSAGLVMPHLRRLLHMPGRIVAEVRQEVRMCAGGIVGSSLSDATEIHTHAKAWEQSSLFLRSLPNPIRHVATSSTAAGARSVAESGDAKALALGTASALRANGLEILAEDVADLKGENNVTQMYVVRKNGHDHQPDPEKRFHAVYLVPENLPGVLHRINGVIFHQGGDLRSQHSCNIGEKTYGFYTEMKREGTVEEFRTMVSQLRDLVRKEILWLGSWDETFVSRG